MVTDNTEIRKTDLSSAAKDVLQESGLTCVRDLLPLVRSDLMQMTGITKTVVNEIQEWITDYKIGIPHVVKQSGEVSIDELPMLSARAYNILSFSGYESLNSILHMTREELLQIPRMTGECADEIALLCKDYIREHPEINEAAESVDENRKIHKYLEHHDPSLSRFVFSAAAANAFKQAELSVLSDIVFMSPERLQSLNNVDSDTAEEIAGMIKNCREWILDGTGLDESDERFFVQASSQNEEPDSTPDTSPVVSQNDQTGLLEYVKINDVRIEDMDITVRTSNALRRAGYHHLSDFIFLPDEHFMSFRGFGKTSAEDLKRYISKYWSDHEEDIELFLSGDYMIPERNNTSSSKQDEPADREKLREFVRENDVSIHDMNVRARTFNALYKAGYRYLSEFIFLPSDYFRGLIGFGKTSEDDLKSYISGYWSEHDTELQAFVSGNADALFPDHKLREMILNRYKGNEFTGFSYPEIKEKLKLPETITDERLKKVIGKMIADHQLEYLDFRCYCVLPKFEDYFSTCQNVDQRTVVMISRKLNGETLQEIADSTVPPITRERVRQIISKGVDKVRRQYQAETGFTRFDEDYYRYLYENYKIEKEALPWIGISVSVLKYLGFLDIKSHGKSLEEAVSDTGLSPALRLRIRNYLYRNKVYADGTWINKRRSDMEDYVLRKYCRDGCHLDEFRNLYNGFLKEIGLENDQKLYFDDSVFRTRKNKLVESRFVLYKYGEMIRYYDIDAQDYTDLLEELNLDVYENTRISTLKLMNEHPDIMKKYDIRDQYELHNLLRKIVKEGSYHGFEAKHMPHINFGTFDRDEALLNMMIDHAPIKQKDLIELIYEEYGYNKKAIPFHLEFLKEYYYNGLYIIDQAVMAPEKMKEMKEILTDDFYYIEEIRKIYKEKYPEDNTDVINPHNLKIMGFNVYSHYALQNYPSLGVYFRTLLTKEDLQDISVYRKRFTYVQEFTTVLIDLKRTREVIEYAPNRLIQIRKLEAAGITEEVLKEYCDEVNDFLEDGEYFSIQSLREDGFSSSLYEQGFEDWFYANVLAFDERFSSGRMFSAMILYKGQKYITIQSFLESLIENAGKIDTFDLVDLLQDTYGCTLKDKSDLRYKLSGSPVYYDEYLDCYYSSMELFDRELDESEETVND